jgi:signal transduction histidine kinase
VRTPVNISQLAREVIGVAEQRLGRSEEVGVLIPTPHRNPTFMMHLQDHYGEPTQDELIIEADENRLKEVLDHLVQNAIFHTSEGGTIDVTIRSLFSLEESRPFPSASQETAAKLVEVQQRYQQLVVIGVHDTGRGIPSRHLTRIFDPFYRVDTRLTREVNGLGLGLAISRRIVELHDGVLWVDSEVGKGSTFYICLPIRGNVESERTRAS